MAAHGLTASVLRPGAVHHSLHMHRLAISVGCKRPSQTRYARVGLGQTPHQKRSVRKAAQLEEAADTLEGDLEDSFEEEDDGTGLSTQQVQSVLHVLCEETEVAELELKMGSFEMRVRRSSRGAGGAAGNITLYANGYTNGASPIPIPPPGTAFASTASMDLGPGGDPAAPPPTVATVDEDFDDESTIFLTAPKVGVMRRGRYVKGKKVGKGNIANVGDEVKKGQPLGFIEQLGTYVPVESPQAGEIVAFVADEGTAVEYAQPIIELVPFFGGHIIGDRKHA